MCGVPGPGGSGQWKPTGTSGMFYAGHGMQDLCKGKTLGGSFLWEVLQTFLGHLLHLPEVSAPVNDPPTA